MIRLRASSFLLLFCLNYVIGFWNCGWFDFECNNGKCIDNKLKCNGIKDCEDGSDEAKCPSVKTTLSPETEKPATVDVNTTARFTRSTGSSGSTTATKSVKLGSKYEYLSVSSDTDVIIQCRGGTAQEEVKWYKPDGNQSLRSASKLDGGRLILPKIKCEDAGFYVCYSESRYDSRRGFVAVNISVTNCLTTSVAPFRSANNYLKTTTYPSTIATVPSTYTVPCRNGTINDSCCYLVCHSGKCITTPSPPTVTSFRCFDGSYVQQSSVCDGIKDCVDGSDELNCSKTCSLKEFRCKDGVCIPLSMHCDGVYQCLDFSDEDGCPDQMPPRIIQLPRTNVEIDCFDTNGTVHTRRTLELECKFAGNPMPIIKWKKYEGLVPAKCIQNSIGGLGILKCPEFQQSDQGAYSCVAENSVGAAESQPKSIVKCSKVTCENGFTVVDEHNIETCLECFCSGKTSSCRGIHSEVLKYEFEFSVKKTVLVDSNGEVTIPTNSYGSIFDFKTDEITYCSLPDDKLRAHSFIESYGRNLNIPLISKNSMVNVPDVIIRGNNLILKHSLNKIHHASPTVDIRFWKGNWHRNNNRVASRNDIMTVLASLDMILIRCEHNEDLSHTTKVILESSRITNSSLSTSYLEKCICPKGYSGLSCQTCAHGYEKDSKSNDFRCIEKSVVCPVGTIPPNCDCDLDKLYYWSETKKSCVKSTCNEKGSVGLLPGNDEKCICKENVMGENCDQCKNGFFYLDALDPAGCRKCWCNDLNVECKSSNWYKSSITSSSWGGYNASNGDNFWLLPPEFSGNKLSSYGGSLHYQMKFLKNRSKQPNPLTVEILTVSRMYILDEEKINKELQRKGKTLKYTDSSTVDDFFIDEKSWEVFIEEPFWRDNYNRVPTREEFLRDLTQVQAIYIESPYPISTGIAKIIRIDLDVLEDISNYAEPGVPDQSTAKVEKCQCPMGYEGFSCETCTQGYYKKKVEGDRFICEMCNCLACDREHGCMECGEGEYRDNPGTDEHPICLECPCNGNEEYCQKDQYGQVLCFCKEGYSGISCQPIISTPTHLKVTITPSKVVNKRVGTLATFNCSYDSTEEDLRIEFQKKYSSSVTSKGLATEFKKIENYGKTSIIEIALEDHLTSIDCVVLDSDITEKGRVSAVIIGTVTDHVKPDITNCYEEYSVFENEDINLVCDAQGVPQPKVSWFIKSNGDMILVDSDEGVHSIKSASLDLNGTNYMCIAENTAGDDKCTTRIFVKSLCDVISIQPPELVVYENDPVKFNCSATSGGSVTWSRLGMLPISASAKIHGGRLLIENAKLSDAGEYECKGSDLGDTSSRRATLLVMKKRIPPRAAIRENDMEVEVGERVVVHCDVSGDPQPKVSWVKIDERLPRNIIISYDGDVMTISNAQVQHSGIYECKAESDTGNMTSRIRITVMDLPEIEIQPKEVVARVDEPLSLKCIVHKGKPLKYLTWSKQFSGEILGSDETLSFLPLELKDAGRYECSAGNSVGSATVVADVKIGMPPTIKIHPEGKLAATAGDVIHISCTAEGEPTPTIKWLKYKKNVRTNGYVPTFDEVLPESSQKINVSVTSDLYKITCMAENSMGATNKSLTFQIYGPSNPNLGKVKRVKIGSRVQLTFSESVGKITCYRGGNSSMIGDECYIMGGIEIPSVQVQHNGTYICRSERGQEMSYNLIVTGFVAKFMKLGKGYMVLPRTTKLSKQFHVEITFKAEDPTGLILSKKRNHGLSIFITNGKLRVRLRRSKDEIFTIESNLDLYLNIWYTVVFLLERNGAVLKIYDERGGLRDNINGTVPFEMDWHLSHDDWYLGGVPRISSERHLPTPVRDIFFGGCISRLEINDYEYIFTEEGKYSRNVSVCDVCSQNPCGRNGVCLDAPTHYGYVCVCNQGETCPSNCAGYGCRLKHDLCSLLNPCTLQENKCTFHTNSLHCQCSAGYSGPACDKEFVSEFRLDGNGYLKLPPEYLPRASLKDPEVIGINFTSNGVDGLLLFQGDQENYLNIYLEHEELFYIYHNQGTELKVSVNIDLEEGTDHQMTVTRLNNTVRLMVNGEYSTGDTNFKTNRVFGDIYIGGVPTEKSNLFTYGSGFFSLSENNFSGFKGCIRGVTFGEGGRPINIMTPKITRRNCRKGCLPYVSDNFSKSMNGQSSPYYDSIPEEDDVEEDEFGY